MTASEGQVGIRSATRPSGHDGVCVCRHVFDQSRPVRLVARHAEGDWSFACGHADHIGAEHGGPGHDGADMSEDYLWVDVGLLLARDASLDPLPELKPDEIAERAAPNSAWMTYPV